ncbi:MAG: RNA polymerase sigma-70 factor [Bacteroidales bacterium]|nr:RNA polymerase sigma-70 factor [Bacteroidales bacterium]
MTGHFDDIAFEQLFRKYFSDLTLFALKYTGDMDTAKEIVHTVFLNLWEKKDTMDPASPVKSYLFTSVRNRCLNHLRDQRKFRKDALFDITVEMAAAETSSSYLETAELQQQINAALDQLPEKCRQVFELKRFEGLKYKDIAEDLGISVKTVEAQMSKALKILREYLQDYFVWYLLLGTEILHLLYQGIS